MNNKGLGDARVFIIATSKNLKIIDAALKAMDIG